MIEQDVVLWRRRKLFDGGEGKERDELRLYGGEMALGGLTMFSESIVGCATQ